VNAAPTNDVGHVRSRSFWLDGLDDAALAPRPALPGDRDVDVAIVGAGFTGLWTAHYLLRRDPTLRVALVDANVAGYGASGRNGGWCSALLPMSLPAIEARHGRAQAIAMQAAMNDTVDEVGREARRLGIDCHYAKGGYVHLARSAAQAARVTDDLGEARRFGLTDDDVRWLTAHEANALVGATGVRGGSYTPHCAALQPALLVRGLADAVRRAGATIYEGTPVTSIEPGRCRTAHGTLRAEVIVRATEGFSATLAGERRTLVPLYSLMIATEPLPPSLWATLRMDGRPTWNDARRTIIYGQRTADDRLAFGGRGAPYHFGSAVDPAFDHHEATHLALRAVLVELFPSLADVAITHAWGGPLGVPRDWTCSVGFDPTTGMAWAGGYVGDGVATTNLAGRTLAALITREQDPLTTLAWVGHRSPRWEPEPLRWLGITAASRMPAIIDRAEDADRRPNRLAVSILERLTGR